MLPTVVFTHVNHNKFTTMIGKFDRESIIDHEDRFKNGKLSLRNLKVDQREVKFSSTDCAAQVAADTIEDDEDFQEILAEILAEEKARKEAEEAASGDSSGKKKGKKGKKGGKKGGGKGKKKSNFESDEL